jgi:hypothetical protein
MGWSAWIVVWKKGIYVPHIVVIMRKRAYVADCRNALV